MSKVVIFGAGQRAREISRLLKTEQNKDTHCFVVDAKYIQYSVVDTNMVISTESFFETYSPDQVELYLGVGMPKMNRIRERLFEMFHSKGFHFEIFVSCRSNVYPKELGEGTTVFAGVNIAPGVKIGMGNHFEMGVTVSHDCRIGDFNFFAPGCTLCGDIEIGRGCFIGSNATVRNSVAIGDYALIGAGAYVDRSIESRQVLVPARSFVLQHRTSDDFM